MAAYYNEFDPFAAAWLRNLIARGLIAPGDVDERSIVDVRADDLRGYDQCHFFAGIGGWSLALRLAGWPDDRPVWTGSCPCQPFSAAGKQRGSEDERHLWPEFFRLIRECAPATVFGEQVEGAIGHGWLDLVFADLEGEGYACGTAVLGAHSVGAPHRRQRLWWVADADSERRTGQRVLLRAEASGRDAREVPQAAGSGPTGRMADADEQQRHGQRDGRAGRRGEPSDDGNVGHADDARLEGRRDDVGEHAGQFAARAAGARGVADDEAGRRREVDPFGSWRTEGSAAQGRERLEYGSSARLPWAEIEWLPCADGKARPTESTVQCVPDGLSDSLGYRRDGDRLVLSPLVHGAKNRVGRLRAYGNAIVPQVAAEFIGAYCEC